MKWEMSYANPVFCIACPIPKLAPITVRIEKSTPRRACGPVQHLVRIIRPAASMAAVIGGMIPKVISVTSRARIESATQARSWRKDAGVNRSFTR